MIRLSGYYPNKPDATFDWDYYVHKHVALFRERLADAGIESITVERGAAGGAPDAPAPHVCVFHALIRRPDRLAELMALHAPEMMADVANFTNVSPFMQFGEVVHQE